MEPEGKPAPATGAEHGSQAVALVPGQKAGGGRYTLVKLIGKGGMGIVWLAKDERLGETLALKLLPAEISGEPAALEDMRRETHKSRKLTHPNIIRIHDIFEAEHEPCFISMEYVDGPNLGSLRLQQPNQLFTWDSLAPLVRQLCDALDYAHGEKVIHRDLKPANMVLDSRGRLKLADFGIAAVVSDSTTRISLKNLTSGTVIYMSPQQMNGQRPQSADDIYALGATLYELLTSRPPFYTGDVVHQVQNLAPPPLTERLAELGLVNEIPPAVSAVVMACLSKDPAQRPPSASAVAEGLGLPSATKSSKPAFVKPKVAPETEIMDSAPTVPVASGERRIVLAGKRKTSLWIGLGLVAVALVLGVGAWLMRDPPVGKKTANTTAAVPVAAVAGAEGWVQLFNGKDLKDWWTNAAGGAWQVVGTSLVADFATKEGDRAINPLGNHADFQLRFATRFQHPKDGVSALRVALREDQRIPGDERAYQICLNDHGDVTAAKFLGAKSNLETYSGTRVTIRDVNGQDVVGRATAFPAVFGKPVFQPDAWTSWFIEASNSTITAFCNGQPVLQLVDEGTKRAREGYIFFHLGTAVDPTQKVEIKDMFLKLMDTTAQPMATEANPRASTSSTANEPGFVPLFTLLPQKRWSQASNTWTFNTGVLTCRNPAPNETDRFTWGLTSLSDFELRFSYRTTGTQAMPRVDYRMKRGTPPASSAEGQRKPESDGGDYYWADLRTQGPYVGSQLGMISEPTRDLVAPGHKAIAWRINNRDVEKVTATLASPHEVSALVQGREWNEVSILAWGNRLVHSINGMVVAELLDENVEKRHLSGGLSFGVTTGANGNSTTEFKNIRIKQLP